MKISRRALLKAFPTLAAASVFLTTFMCAAKPLANLGKQRIIKKIDFFAPWSIQAGKKRNEFIVSGDQYIGAIDSGFNAMRQLPLAPYGVAKNFSSGHLLFI